MRDSKRDVLIVGQEFSGFVVKLYDAICEKSQSFTFLSEWRDELGRAASYTVSNSIEKIGFKDTRRLTVRIKALLLILFRPYVYKDLFLVVIYNNFRGLRSTLNAHWKSALMLKGPLSKRLPKVFHYHYIEPANLRYIDYLPKHVKVVCTFWGSDIFLGEDVWFYYQQQKALKRADRITVSTPEMKRMVVSKYGVGMEEKICHTFFSLSPQLFSFLDTYLNQPKVNTNNFKSRFNVPNGSVVVAIANNGNRRNNHLKIIRALAQLKEDTKQQICLLFHMSYGVPKDGYLDEVRKLVENSGIKYVIVTAFLTDEDLAQMRMVTDIYIHLPETDALSGTAIEYMYAGKILLTGAWLPYSLFHKIGLRFFDVQDFHGITDSIEKILSGRTQLEEEVQKNRDIIGRALHPKSVADEWISLYNMLFNNS